MGSHWLPSEKHSEQEPAADAFLPGGVCHVRQSGPGAGLSDKNDPADRALHARRGHRYDGANTRENILPILGQAVVVENRGGASGAIGTDIAAKAAPDGYTWVLGTDPPFTINQHLRKLPYDPVRDFAPVSLLATVPLVLVANPSVKAENSLVKYLIALAKASPGKITMASSGTERPAGLSRGRGLHGRHWHLVSSRSLSRPG